MNKNVKAGDKQTIQFRALDLGRPPRILDLKNRIPNLFNKPNLQE
jgi:hypothetical protein